ncbi:hypothetical protein NXS19_005693 [Fusarium pseudograminearum]|nr:hypothetical protein NXS19_005693 [Fusarium pseudograminearum]
MDDLNCGCSSTELQVPAPDSQTRRRYQDFHHGSITVQSRFNHGSLTHRLTLFAIELGQVNRAVDNANRSGAFFSISHRLGSTTSHATRALSGKDFGRKRSAN